MPGPPPGYRKQMIRQKMARRVEVVVLVVLLVISFAHLLRLLTGIRIVIDGVDLPLWVSLLGCIGPAILAGLFWWSHR